MTRPYLIILSILVCSFIIRSWFYYHNISKYINRQQVDFSTTLLSEPRILGNTQSFSAFLEGGQRVTVVLQRFPELHYGDTVRISGAINERVLQNKRTAMTIYMPQITAVKNESNVILSLAAYIRQKVTTVFHKSLPSPASNLLLGIVFGIKEDMPKDFILNLRSTGVLHVIAASGMNVTMIGGFLSSVFGLLFRRQIALLFAIVSILFYSLLSGFEPSIIRAAIMGSLTFGAQIFGRQYMAGYALVLSGYGMVMYDPSLLFDIGFQLSFSATLGLIMLKPLFGDSKLLTEDMVTTISAQIATLPILLANFGTYSLISIAVNGFVLWTIPPLMVIGGLGAIVGFVSELLGTIILYLAIPLLFYFEYIVNLFGGLGWGISLDRFPWQFSVSYYLLLASYVAWCLRLQKHQ